MIIYVDLRLTVLAFVPMILVAIGCYFFGVQMKKRQTARQEAFSFLSDKVQERYFWYPCFKGLCSGEEGS